MRALPDDPQLATALGGLELERGDDAAAAIAYRRALRLRPQDSVILRQLGWALLNQQQHDEAAPLLERALSIDPEDTEVLLLLGRARHQQWDLVEARRLLEESIERERGNPWAHYSLAQVLATAGQFHAALDSVQRAIRLDPKDERFRGLQRELRNTLNPIDPTNGNVGPNS